VEQALVKERGDMVIVQGIVDYFAFFPVFDQFGMPERPQLVGNGGFCHAKQGGNVADAHFGVEKGADYPDPCGIAENLE
jgi:energy-converting hydrogenase Eha subunit B